MVGVLTMTTTLRSYAPKGRLPGRPSALIRLALADLRTVEVLPDLYKVSMAGWHSGSATPSGRCFVCLAGAVMAQTLGAPVGEEINPSAFPGPEYDALMALNAFRVGAVSSGLQSLKLPQDVRWPFFPDWNMCMTQADVPPYNTLHPTPFHVAMLDLAARLEAEGL